MAKGDGKGEQGNSKGTNRARWATRKLTVRSGGQKQASILERIQRGTGTGSSTEKKRASAISEAQQQQQHQQQQQGSTDNDDDDTATANDQSDAKSTGPSSNGESRTLFFNQPLPPEMKDEEGNPLISYARNKIRTAKYTPLSFIPKNLWFQFQNIANVFFLFLVILVVSRTLLALRAPFTPPCHPPPPLLYPSLLCDKTESQCDFFLK